MDYQNNQNDGNTYAPNTITGGSPGLGIASMVCGIIALVFSCCLYYISIPLSIIAVILGGVAIAKKNNGKGMAVAGLVTGIIALVPAILVIIFGSSILSALSGMSL